VQYQRSSLLMDHLGSASLTTGITGAVVSEMRFTPFSEVRWQNGVSVSNHQFTGARYDATSNIVQMGARWYSPLLGRFLSADSIVPRPGDSQAYNRYTYARNSPLVRVDPSGHADCAAGDGACWANEWMWKNRWYEAHGHFWGGNSWTSTGLARFADIGILNEVLGEVGIGYKSGDKNWGWDELEEVAQGIVAFGNKLMGAVNLKRLLIGSVTLIRYTDGTGNCLGTLACTFGTDMIQLYDEAFTGNVFRNATATVVHELAHIIDRVNVTPGGVKISSAFPFSSDENAISSQALSAESHIKGNPEYFAEAISTWVFPSYSTDHGYDALQTYQSNWLYHVFLGWSSLIYGAYIPSVQ